MEIRLYLKKDAAQLFEIMKEEGTDWECYYSEAVKEKYQQALDSSITFVVCQGDILCGYVRCRNDNGFGVYVYDLLVKKSYRGQKIGQKLMDFVRSQYPENTVYVMSGVDEYYEKLGYNRAGSIFIVG